MEWKNSSIAAPFHDANNENWFYGNLTLLWLFLHISFISTTYFAIPLLQYSQSECDDFDIYAEDSEETEIHLKSFILFLDFYIFFLFIFKYHHKRN